jgi:predicted nucleotidyltransferase component of viral defense system
VLVAKSATVRHLATHGKYKDLFVLKGGTLLSNVYRSPRQSIADADYTYLDPENLKVPNLEDALAANGEYGFYLYPEEGQWSYENEMFDGKSPFHMDELAAEKLLGWCGKPLPKHLVDLAYLAREHHEHISREQVAKLVHRKFEMEKGARRYRDAGIRSPADLVAAFTKENKLKDATTGNASRRPSCRRRAAATACNRRAARPSRSRRSRAFGLRPKDAGPASDGR